MKRWLSVATSVVLIFSVVGCGSNGTDGVAGTPGINGTNGKDAPLKGYFTPRVGTDVALNDTNFPLSTVTFANGFELNATWGIGSGATHKVTDANDTFYTLTDRGVNIKCKDSKDVTGMDICKDGKIFPFPGFTPTIMKFKIDKDEKTATILEVTPLKDRNGKNISGVSNPISNFSEIAYDINGKKLPLDIDGIDSEAIAAMNDGTFWISEEYSPSLLHIAADGKVIKRLVPKGLESEYTTATYDVEGSLPAILIKRHENRGIESIAVSPDQNYLYFMMQSPLDNPDYSKSQNVRLYKMSIADPSNIKEYLFVIDKPDVFTTDNLSKKRKQKDVKVSDMEALGNGKLMIDERIHTSRLFTVDLTSATPVTKEQSANLETNTTGVTPLTKTLVFSTDPVNGDVNATDGYPEKIEGVAHLGGSKFLLINDNDFGIFGDKTVAKIADINVTK